MDVYDLHNHYRPDFWGVPGHWRVVRGVTLYAAAHLLELATALEERGKAAEAAKLRAWLIEHASPPAVAARQQAASEDPWFRKGAYA